MSVTEEICYEKKGKRGNMTVKDEMVVMCDVSDSLTIEKAKSIYETIEDESALAYLYSIVENTAWWYAHDIDDYVEDTMEYQNMCKKQMHGCLLQIR